MALPYWGSGSAAALRRHPGDVLGRVLHIAGLAVHAVLEVDLELRLAVVPLDHLVDPGRAVALGGLGVLGQVVADRQLGIGQAQVAGLRSEEHTSELQSRPHLVCRLLLEKKKNTM